MKYGIRTGVQHQKTNLKKIIIGCIVGMTAASALAVPVFAAGDGLQASPCGAVHGAFADINGNFGFLGGDGGTPGYHSGAIGQDPGATGYNNSHTNCQQ